jgi:hypothetical protein
MQRYKVFTIPPSIKPKTCTSALYPILFRPFWLNVNNYHFIEQIASQEAPFSATSSPQTQKRPKMSLFVTL